MIVRTKPTFLNVASAIALGETQLPPALEPVDFVLG